MAYAQKYRVESDSHIPFNPVLIPQKQPARAALFLVYPRNAGSCILTPTHVPLDTHMNYKSSPLRLLFLI